MLVFFSKLLTPKLKKFLKLEKYDIINIQGVNRISFIIQEESNEEEKNNNNLTVFYDRFNIFRFYNRSII